MAAILRALAISMMRTFLLSRNREDSISCPPNSNWDYLETIPHRDLPPMGFFMTTNIGDVVYKLYKIIHVFSYECCEEKMSTGEHDRPG
jgi:hypothetical protein